MSEAALQGQVFQWHWNNYPQERGLLCYNLNNSKNKIDGLLNKAIGLIKGRSDMTYYSPTGKAVMLEFKTPIGYQSKEQKEWQANIELAGYPYHIIRSLDDFKAVIGIYQTNPVLTENK